MRPGGVPVAAVHTGGIGLCEESSHWKDIEKQRPNVLYVASFISPGEDMLYALKASLRKHRTSQNAFIVR